MAKSLEKEKLLSLIQKIQANYPNY
ncbi:uncharacterized protein FFNC_09665 [Fusarium fujikuroi]|nr:uncharacterized protein FFNC_09665 [Fusarium fujikuroi]